MNPKSFNLDEIKKYIISYNLNPKPSRPHPQKNFITIPSASENNPLFIRKYLHSPHLNPNDKFRIMSYNVLAPSLAETHSTFLSDSEKKHFDWSSRSKIILQEIQYYDPDILCLQEVDHDSTIFHENFEPFYFPFYHKRTNEKKDGCLTMVKKSKYRVLESHYLDFYQDINHPILCRDNICLLLAIQPLDFPNQIFIIANTHILYNKNRGDIKTAQIHLGLKACSKLAQKYQQKDVHIICTGDFNSTPKSPLYEFIKNAKFDFRDAAKNILSGQTRTELRNQLSFESLEQFLIKNTNKFTLNPSYKEKKTHELLTWIWCLKDLDVQIKKSPGNQIEKVEYEVIDLDPDIFRDSEEHLWTLENDFPMQSAYSAFRKLYHGPMLPEYPIDCNCLEKSTYEPICTHRTIEALCTVDYIWYCTRDSKGGGRLEPVGIYEMPMLEESWKRFKMFPNSVYPSDHLALIVDFQVFLDS